MKGFLHRLAERAAGTAPMVRPNAALPFVAPPRARDESGDALLFPERTDTRRTVPRADEPMLPGAPPRPDGPVAHAAEPAAEARARRDVGPAHAGDPVRKGDPGGPVPHAPEPMVRRLRVDGADAADAADAPAPPTRFVGPAATPPVRIERTSRRAAREPDPTPLRPTTPLIAASALRPAALRSAIPSPTGVRGRADEPAEVHIHIGRIDVSAARETPPARRKPVAAPPATSLDDYLARRQSR